MADSRYRTLPGETRHEIDKIRGSRFLATAGPLVSEDQLAVRIDALRSEFPAANHHCYAWRVAERFRYSDDGEPSGTAGRPILRQIDGHALSHVFVVVTRIFGGTKLGAGGLVRAYSAAAGQTLDLAPFVEVVPTRTVHVALPYTLLGTLQSIAHARGLSPVDAQFTDGVAQAFEVPAADIEGFVDEIRQRTAGRAEVSVEP